MEALDYFATRALAWVLAVGIVAFIVHINRPCPPQAPTGTGKPMWP